MLSDYEKELLREIYAIPDDGDIVVGDNTALAQNYIPVTATMTVKQRFLLALDSINRSAAKTKAVSEILCAYQDFRLDRSPIDKDGYSFRAAREERNLLRRLFPYTNILVSDRTGNTMRLG
jgi:hypothetical protein